MYESADWSAEIAGRRVTLDENGLRFEVKPADDSGRFVIEGPDGPMTAVAAISGDVVWVALGGHAFNFRIGHASSASRAASLNTDALMPPMPATVTRILVNVGDHVRQGDLLIALEAMKMELPIRAPEDFVVEAIHCAVGDLVQPGTVLID